ncbi:MAG: polyphosphate polymerase domain-containing protein [Eubacteriales bacterium]
MGKEVFNRHELKYVLDVNHFDDILQDLSQYIVTDPYGDEDGFYTISSIYYDTVDDLFHYERMKGQTFRQKVRLRTYNKPDNNSDVYLEIKKKFKAVVNKRRVVMPLNDAYKFLNNDYNNIYELKASNYQILKEVLFLKSHYKLVPKVTISYERQAFIGIKDNDLRITFDSNIRKRKENMGLEKGNYGERYIKSKYLIFEIKTSKRIPLWLSRILSKYNCCLESFSKYSNSYINLSGDSIQEIRKVQ